MEIPTQPSRGVGRISSSRSHELPVERRYQEGDILAGKYRLSRSLAAGGMGTVWSGHNVPLELPVAIKMFHRHGGGGDTDILEPGYLGQCLYREARAMAAIRHSAVAKVYDFGFTEWGDPYIAMELLEGETLGHFLAREGPLDPERALQLMLPIADGLVGVHALGIVHCDLKPENIFLARGDNHRLQPKLVDFGIARLAFLPTAPRTEDDRDPFVLGTPTYLAPEQMTSQVIDGRTDVWAFSIVLYELLSGRLPFASKCLPQTLVAFHEPVSLASEVGRELWSILERGLRKNPADRWPSMAEFGAALSDWLLARGITEDATGRSLATQWSMHSDAHGCERERGARVVAKRTKPARVVPPIFGRGGHRNGLVQGAVAVGVAVVLSLALAERFPFAVRDALSQVDHPASAHPSPGVPLTLALPEAQER